MKPGNSLVRSRRTGSGLLELNFLGGDRYNSSKTRPEPDTMICDHDQQRTSVSMVEFITIMPCIFAELPYMQMVFELKQ